MIVFITVIKYYWTLSVYNTWYTKSDCQQYQKMPANVYPILVLRYGSITFSRFSPPRPKETE